MISGHPCRSQERVPSKSNTTWLICGRGEKLALNSIGPVNELTENICSSVKSVSTKTSIMAKLRLLALTGALALIIGLAWVIARKPHQQACRLPDGSELSLVGVTFGKQHQ